jgi:hypothetical protein
MPRTPQRTANQDFIVTSGDAFVGEDGGGVTINGGGVTPSGDGGSIVILASTATGLGDGGSITATAGNAGVGDPGDIFLNVGTTGARDGQVILARSGFQLTERAAVAGPTITAGQGRLWVRNDAPNILVFTDDTNNVTSLGLHAPERGQYSVMAFGASLNPSINSTGAFQAACNACSAGGGGYVLVPPVQNILTQEFLVNTVSVPANVTLMGFGPRSRIRARPLADAATFQFALGSMRSGVRDLSLFGNEAAPLGTGISFAGSQFNRVSGVQIWDFRIGVDVSDGILDYAGYNRVRDFEINRCWTGVRAYNFANQNSFRDGRIFFSINAGNGIAIDIDDANCLTFEDVAIESMDIGLRVRGIVQASFKSCYFETGDPARRFVDFNPDTDTGSSDPSAVNITFEACHAGVNNSVMMNCSFEEMVRWDSLTEVFFGAQRDAAATTGRNLVENGDLHRIDTTAGPPVAIPQWSYIGTPDIAVNTVDWVTAGRSLDVTQDVSANDGVSVLVAAPEVTEYITACFRYKSISSDEVTMSLVSGGNSANFVDITGPDAVNWRVRAITVRRDTADAGVLAASMAADSSAAGGEIRVDEIWAVAGRVASASREHGHRIELLDRPISLIAANSAADITFGPLNVLTLTAPYANAPRGTIGIMGRMKAATAAGTVGQTITDAAVMYVDYPFGIAPAQIRMVIDRTQWQFTQDFIVRDTTITGGINFSNAGFGINFSVEILGWILP